MRNRIVTVFITLMFILFTLACNLPLNIATAPQPEEKIVYMEITSTPEEVIDPTDENITDEEIAITATVSVDLDGPWTIWQGSAKQQLMIDFLQQGFNLTGNAAIGNEHSILFKGIINQDGTKVTGTWETTSGTSGNFTMYLSESLSIFSGNLGSGVPFCGTRVGTSQPQPCLK
ncbi:MAG: hypothetical protein J7K66_00465 [Anaerolineaceae bacterium]|nr:hypothetical protein [Anaerolineaceae bacterium]